METTKEFVTRKNKEFGTKNKIIWMKDIGRKGRHGFKREAWVFLPASNLRDHKVFVFERLRHIERSGKFAYNNLRTLEYLEYRIGYYMRGQIRNAKSRWIWGQFCPMIPVKDLDRLLKMAKQKRVIV